MRPPTAKGAAARSKILDAAASLFHRHGVHGTSVDDILDACGAGKSQFYHYFSSKEELVSDVVHLQMRRVLEQISPALEQVERFEDLALWREALVRLVAWTRNLGCPIGIVALECPDSDLARKAVQQALSDWAELHGQTLARLKKRGEFTPEFRPGEAARFAGTVLQGAMLLGRAFQDPELVVASLDAYLTYLERFRATGRAGTRPARPRG
ncbi:MAG: TetR/AcrR family transcriptional regulator [Candidatus Eremiobacterota bacterium]